jgi:hypothetical protein
VADNDTRVLWKILDQLHTAAQDAQHKLFTLEGLHDYVLKKTTEARAAVPYPGEPDGSDEDEGE